MSYVVVNAADDAILAECESPADVPPLMRALREEYPEVEVRIAWFGEHDGELVGTEVFASARSLTVEEGFALYGRRRRRR